MKRVRQRLCRRCERPGSFSRHLCSLVGRRMALLRSASCPRRQIALSRPRLLRGLFPAAEAPRLRRSQRSCRCESCDWREVCRVGIIGNALERKRHSLCMKKQPKRSFRGTVVWASFDSPADLEHAARQGLFCPKMFVPLARPSRTLLSSSPCFPTPRVRRSLPIPHRP